jgi:hypothetical protein
MLSGGGAGNADPASLSALRRALVHTDEYEISLSREVGVCDSAIRKCRRILGSMEARHGMTTAEFLERVRLGRLPATPDFTEWQKSIKKLRYWTETRSEYQGLLDIMKVSAS